MRVHWMTQLVRQQWRRYMIISINAAYSFFYILAQTFKTNKVQYRIITEAVPSKFRNVEQKEQYTAQVEIKESLQVKVDQNVRVNR